MMNVETRVPKSSVTRKGEAGGSPDLVNSSNSSTTAIFALGTTFAPLPDRLASSGVITKTKKQRVIKSSKSSHPHLVVQHNYHDHARDPVVVSVPNTRENRNNGGVTQPFPFRLYEMLERVEEDGQDHVVCWQPHGRCFVVHNPEAFKELLPRYFKQTKIQSFQRQLNLYGFQRLTVGLDKGGYYHELFLRGRMDLLYSIPRSKIKGTGVRAKSSPETEPNFWKMQFATADVDHDGSSSVNEDACRTTALEQQSRPTTTPQYAAPTISSLSVVSQCGDSSINPSPASSAASSSGDTMSEEDDLAEPRQQQEQVSNRGQDEDYFDRILDKMFENEDDDDDDHHHPRSAFSDLWREAAMMKFY